MRLRATRLSSLRQNPILAGLALDRLNAAAAYSLRRLRTAYSGPLVRVRRSSDNVEADIGFTSAGDLDLDALTAHCQVPRRPLTAMSASAAAAYSLRLIRAAYSGPAIRVRRSSDNAEADIRFTATGDLDTVALLAFTGAGSGFVSVWYDQSGNARDAAQATAAFQPRIVNAGAVETEGSRPAVRFGTSANQSLRRTDAALATVLCSANWAGIAVTRCTDTASNRHVFGNRTANGFMLRANAGGAAWQPNIVGAANVTLSATTTDLQVISTLVTAGQMAAGKNGGALTVGTTGTALVPSSNELIIGGGNSGSVDWSGTISEIVILASALSTTDRELIERSQCAYYGITHASPVSGFVATWYDQSGNGRNATQATAGLQPRIVNAGVVETLGARSAVRFPGNAFMNFTNVASQPTSVNAVVRLNSAVTGAHITDGSQTSPRTLLGIVAPNWVTFAGSVGTGPAYTLGASTVLTATFNGASSLIAQNGAGVAVNPGTQGMSNQRLGAGDGGTTAAGIDGWIQEFTVLNSLISTADRQTLERNQGAYYGIAVA